MKLVSAAMWKAFSTTIVFVVTAVIFGLFYGSIHLDLWINPWLREVNFEWIQLISTQHGISLLYLHNPVLVLWILGAIALFFSGIIVIFCVERRDF